MKTVVRLVAALALVFFAVPLLYYVSINDLHGTLSGLSGVLLVGWAWAWVEEMQRRAR